MNTTRILNPPRPLWPGFSSSKSLCGDANCMEQLLLHCANAIESNDATLAQHIIWVLNNLASPDGDSTQRLASSFLRALMSRAASKIPAFAFFSVAATAASVSRKTLHRFSVIELAEFVDLTPWHRFGFIAANAAILDAVEGYSSVHIVDLSLTNCMQMPTLIDSLANKLHKQPPPLLKLTVIASDDESHPPPLLEISYEELGSKLVNFATTRNIAMEFRIISSSYSDGLSSLIEQLRNDPFVFNEALVVNCHMMLHYIPDETLTSNPTRSVFLKELRDLNPTIVTLIDEDADFTSTNLISRLRSLYNYMWIPYDTADMYLTRGSEQRQWYEADVSWKIDNVIAKEGAERVERLEPKSRWFERMREAKFAGVGFGEEVATEAKTMLEEHATGWGMKRDVDEDDDVERFVLTWKGHSVVFASSWAPINGVVADLI
ncbi:PREDICTED: scarecrow-like protein 32 [Camelina sativa]|uniref:Scarecrow-like protein 32 n=1 Tax=Camelina sativa TaxID=90675 RepID=A0ABM0UQQ0_CAMSA|nr:PREDICTED: scarecrow-like protein 32 [Camelina sativa]